MTSEPPAFDFEPDRPPVRVDTPCTRCGAYALEIFFVLEARPLGTWSLSGRTPKAVASPWPYMRCVADRGGCGAECRGHEVDDPASAGDVPLFGIDGLPHA